MISIQFSLIESHAISRTFQPISQGFPFVEGALFSNTELVIKCGEDHFLSCQVSPLTFWPDGSVKWAIVDFFADIKSNEALSLTLTDTYSSERTQAIKPIQLHSDNGRLNVDTGLETFSINTNNGELLTFDSAALLNSELGRNNKEVSFELTSIESHQLKAVIESAGIDISEKTSHRKSLIFNGGFVDDNNNLSELKFESTLTFFANSSYVKVDFTLHNPKAAVHPGGLWDLGDEGSCLFKSLVIKVPLESDASTAVYDHISEKEMINDHQIFLKQFSSGGVNWKSPAHKNSSGAVDVERKGFVIDSVNEEAVGQRISPVFKVYNTNTTTSAYLEGFWQNFPKAISKQEQLLSIELFPEGIFELQGGEKKTHTLWLDLKSDKQNFDWVDKPLSLIIAPEYLELTNAFDFFCSKPSEDEISTIIDKGIQGKGNFFAKREVVDEFGWRNFGDLYADHETQGYSGDEIFVSHYNNQYDPIYGFLNQYLISGNSSYFELADDLAKHVVDIDIYHTNEDKDEYNGGLFWHTDHYLDASTCSHRTFSKNHQAAYQGYSSGGGPGGQHCYTTGLKSFYLLTGNESAKAAVLKLADWVTFSFEGSNSFLAKLFAIKQSGNHGSKDHLLEKYPMDRGTGHYIIALLDAYDLTSDGRFVSRAFTVISNTFHPNDDIALRKFSNIEATWFYTVFLQSVGRFLMIKERNNELDDDFYYARDAMLHYASWMLENELPYLEQVDKLEFPNTTWAGQDLRKVGIFYMAYYYSTGKDDRYIEKAEYFYRHISMTLKNDINNDYTRIIVLLMQNIGFANYYKNNISKNTFESITDYSDPVLVNKKIKTCKLLIKELSRLSIKNELKWLSLRSAKVAKLLGKKG